MFYDFICFSGEIEELLADPVEPSNFIPLSDSICWAIHELTGTGKKCNIFQNNVQNVRKPKKLRIFQKKLQFVSKNQLKLNYIFWESASHANQFRIDQ